MRNSAISLVSAIRVFLCAAAILLATSTVSVGDYMKMDPPPDVDKADHLHGNKPTCWVAAGSNLLAGAGYGDGNNVQQRADDIYDELCDHLVDCNKTGWDDSAIQKWLESGFNTQKNANPYTLVKVFGNRITHQRYPYSRTDLPELIGDHLRRCSFLSLSSSKVDCNDVNVGKFGHSTACWGDDDADVNDINTNPGKVKISDSDYWNITVPVQTYTYDDYNNPNPDECNEGPGWYFNYNDSDNHRYIDGYVTLEPNTDAFPNPRVLVASAKFTYNGNDPCALDLHYKISSNKQLLSYRTSIDWDTNNSPTFTEDTNWVRVEWDLSDNPVPQGSFVTATAEIVVPYDANGNSISIDSVLWTPMHFEALPGSFMWGRHYELPGGPAMYAPNMCGGYVVCACMIFADQYGTQPVGEYRWVLDYDYYQDPCHHDITFEPNVTGPGPYYMGFFRFGHSYGFLMDDELEPFDNWITYEYPVPPFPLLGTRTFMLNWTGQLPYPQGQDYLNPVPDECGDPGTYYYGGDINKDCYVDFEDFALFAGGWLGCTDPEDPNCL
ncbi:MAG: hypothetical protein ABII09_08715 [Planctomycetota bacterium]